MVQHSHVQRFQCLIITLYHLASALQHTLITLHLHQSDSSHHIRHVTLIPCADNVILPSSELSLSQSIFVLTMQTQQLCLAIKILSPSLSLNLRHTTERIIHILVQVLHHLLITERQIPRQGPPLSSSEVLHSMERERREVGNCSHHLSLARSTKGMGSIAADSNTTKHLLQVGLRSKHLLLAFHDTIQSVVIARNTSQVNRNNCLGIRSDSLLYCLIVHLKAILLHIHKHQLGTNMLHNRSTCCIGIGRHNHLVALTNAQQSKSHLTTSSLRVKAYSLLHTNKLSNFFL